MPDTPHLDDEQLGTLLDELDANAALPKTGAAPDTTPSPDSAQVDHLDHCRTCQERLDQIRTVTEAVASLATAPDPQRKEAHIAAAIAAAAARGTERPGPPAVIADFRSDRPAARPLIKRPHRGREKDRHLSSRSSSASILRVAAVVVALAGTGAVVVGLGQLATRNPARKTTAAAAALSTGASSSSPQRPNIVDLGDLGNHSNAKSLAAAVDQRHKALQDLAAVSAKAALKRQASKSTDQMSARATTGSSPSAPAAAGTVAPPAASQGDRFGPQGTSSAAGATAPPPVPCLREAMDAASRSGVSVGALQSSGRLSWQDTPAEVLVFELHATAGGTTPGPTGAPSVQFEVMSVANCSALASFGT